MAAMMKLLAPDVTMWSDSGGKVTAARRPVVGADRVVRWLFGVLDKPQAQGVEMEITEINGEAALLAVAGNDVVGAVSLEVDGGRVVGMRLMLNPEKLDGLRRAPGTESQ
jgi:RNA polymerase sigma-70 factor (ECF subfamily)